MDATRRLRSRQISKIVEVKGLTSRFLASLKGERNCSSEPNREQAQIRKDLAASEEALESVRKNGTSPREYLRVKQPRYPRNDENHDHE